MAPPRKRFRDLPKTEQARRISVGLESGRLSEEKAAAARRFWRLPPPTVSPAAKIFGAESVLGPWEVPRTPKRPPLAPIVSGGRISMVPGRLTAPQQRAADQAARAARVKQAERIYASPRARQQFAQGVTPERAKQLRREGVLKGARRFGDTDVDRFWSFDPRKSIPAAGRIINRAVERTVERGADDLYDLLSPEQQEETEQYWRETLGMSQRGARKFGRAINRGSSQLVETEAQRMGLDQGVAKGAAEVVGNFLGNISEGAIGLPVGAVAIALDPVKTSSEILSFYGDFYEPLLKGDLEQFGKNLKKNPDMALDWLGGLGLVAGGARRVGVASRAGRAAGPTGAVRGLVTGKEPLRLVSGRVAWGKRVPVRTVKVRESLTAKPVDTGVQRYVPGSAAGQLLSDALARFSPATGKRRYRKAVREDIEANRTRLFGEIEGFRSAGREVQKDPGLRMAFDRWMTLGGDAAFAADRVRREIVVREEMGLTETPAQQAELQELRLAEAVLEDPPRILTETVDRGRVIAGNTQELLIGAGVLNPITAERMLRRPAQFLEEVPDVQHPVRDQMEETLREAWGEDNPQVDVALNWLDASAISYGRRTEQGPGAFYDDLYADVGQVEHADIYDQLLDEDPELLAQYGIAETPLAISPERSRLYRVANEELQGLHGAERQQAALRRAVPKHKQRVTTIEQKYQRIIDQIPSQVERREYGAWYRNLWPQFGRYFGEDVEAAIRTFLISQAAMSPSDGVLAMLKMLEYYNVNGRWPPKGTISHNTQAMVHAWKNANLGEDPAGVAAKIADFFGSAYGEGTRAWMQHMPNSGPGVVDRWTLRSDGFLDHNAYGSRSIIGLQGAPNPNQLKVLKKQAADETLPQAQRDAAGEAYVELRKQLAQYYDMSSGPSRYQYEWSSIRLNQLRDLMNEQRLDGRSDWSVDEAQALDWFATRREWGEVSGGWEDTWARNTFNITGEITGEMRKEWLAEGSRGAIITDVTTNGSHGRVTILGTKTQAAALAKRLADESGRNAYVFYDAGMAASGNRTLGLVTGGDPDHAFNTLRNLTTEELDGLLLLPSGDGGLRIMFSDPEGVKVSNARKQRDALLEDLRRLGVEAEPVASRMEIHRGRARPDRSLYRGDDPRGILARAAAARRRRTDFRVGPVVGEGGARQFVAGLAANARAWSLSPRAVEDFLEEGYQGFLTEDGNAGAAISPDGEIVSLFNSGSFSGAGGQVLVEALAQGGSWLNAYDGFLPAYYANLGFREVARLRFADNYAPEGWNYTLGRPDIVFMAYDPTRPVKRAKYVNDWDAGEAAAKRAGAKGLQKRPVESLLEELANRGDGMPYGTLAQWKRVTKTTVEDPVIQGAVRFTDDGVELSLTEAANLSTLIHENAHAMLRATLGWLRQSEDPRLEPVARLLGIDDTDGPISRESQELFARAVEFHAYTGSMPAPQVRAMLSETQKLMSGIYRAGLKQIADTPEQAAKIEKLVSEHAFSSLLDDLLDVTFGVERQPNAVFMPRLEATSPGRISGFVRRAATFGSTRSTITPPRRTTVAKGSKNLRFERGEYRKGPDVVAGYATAGFRWELARITAEEIYRSPLAKGIGRDENGNFFLEDDHVPFVYGNAPGAMRKLDAHFAQADREGELLFDRDPQEAAIAVHEATEDAFGADVVPADLDRIDRYSLPQLIEDRQIVQIPIFMRDAYIEAMAGGKMLSSVAKVVKSDVGPLGKVPVTAGAIVNAMARWNMVGKLGYMTTNTIGAMATATAHNPLWVGEIRKASEHLASWQPESLRMLDEMVGAGSFEMSRLLTEDTKWLPSAAKWERKRFEQWTQFLTVPERRIRRMVAARQLRMAGYGDETDFRALVEAAKSDERARMTLNQIGRFAEDAVVRFRGQNETEKWIVRRAVFVYGWLRAALRYTFRFPLEHPILAAVMNRLGNEGWDEIQEELQAQMGLRGGIVLREGERDGEHMARIWDFSSVFPFASGAQVARVLASPLYSLTGVDNPFIDTFTDTLSEGTAFGLALGLGEDSPRGMSVDKLLEPYTSRERGFAAVPFVNWLMRIMDPGVTETKTLGPRSSPEVVANFLFGQLVPRDTKLDAAQEAWMKQQPITISGPIRVQKNLDLLRDRYAAAVAQNGDAESEEWNIALQAHASYDLSTSLRDKEWRSLSEEEREQERAIVKAKILKHYFPPVYESLHSQYKGTITSESVAAIDSAYSDWIGEPYSNVRSYIRDTLGEAAVP